MAKRKKTPVWKPTVHQQHIRFAMGISTLVSSYAAALGPDRMLVQIEEVILELSRLYGRLQLEEVNR